MVRYGPCPSAKQDKKMRQNQHPCQSGRLSGGYSSRSLEAEIDDGQEPDGLSAFVEIEEADLQGAFETFGRVPGTELDTVKRSRPVVEPRLESGCAAMVDIYEPVLPPYEISTHPIVKTILKSLEVPINQMDGTNLDSYLVSGGLGDQTEIQTADIFVHGVDESDSQPADRFVGRAKLDWIE